MSWLIFEVETRKGEVIPIAMHVVVVSELVAPVHLEGSAEDLNGARLDELILLGCQCL